MRYLCQESAEASFGDDLMFVKRYLIPIIRDEKGVGSSVANVECDFGILIFGDDQICLPTTFSVPIGFAEMKHNVFPWLISSGQLGQNASYVSSPLMQYAGYAVNDLYKLKLSILPYIIVRFILSCLIVFFCITSLDSVVYVNNFLLSTNLYPDFLKLYDEKELKILFEKALALLARHHPGRVILFRSIDDFGTSKVLKKILIQKPFNMKFVLSRKIHYQEVIRRNCGKEVP